MKISLNAIIAMVFFVQLSKNQVASTSFKDIRMNESHVSDLHRNISEKYDKHGCKHSSKCNVRKLRIIKSIHFVEENTIPDKALQNRTDLTTKGFNVKQISRRLSSNRMSHNRTKRLHRKRDTSQKQKLGKISNPTVKKITKYQVALNKLDRKSRIEKSDVHSIKWNASKPVELNQLTTVLETSFRTDSYMPNAALENVSNSDMKDNDIIARRVRDMNDIIQEMDNEAIGEEYSLKEPQITALKSGNLRSDEVSPKGPLFQSRSIDLDETFTHADNDSYIDNYTEFSTTFTIDSLNDRNIPQALSSFPNQNGADVKTRKDVRDAIFHEKISVDEDDLDDTAISYGTHCDQIQKEECWLVRGIGDTVTLTVNISSSKEPSSFLIRWIKIFHKRKKKKNILIEIQPGRIPWNMIWGGDGRELRIDPVTNSDVDPNAIAARVFLIEKKLGRKIYQTKKELKFHIDIPAVDMGNIYPGEELNINLENYLSLPERGNMLFDWTLEQTGQRLALPSNFRVSPSGRSVLIKELKKTQTGVLMSVAYSSSRLAVAKRKFSIRKISDNLIKRSLKSKTGEPFLSNRCLQAIRRSLSYDLKRILRFIKPISRKKRFWKNFRTSRTEQVRRRNSHDTAGCKNSIYRHRLYARWIRPLLGEPTTLDPRVMPIETLIALSENSDGTLDDLIPREIHYITPIVKLFVHNTISDVEENYVSERPYMPNCTANSDCAPEAVCIILTIGTTVGYCQCQLEYFGDGSVCFKIPIDDREERKVRRQIEETADGVVVPPALFFSRTTSTTTARANEEFSEKLLAFEEEESFILGMCSDNRDCSVHAACSSPPSRHPYCRCRPGFRGNGIFCWEIIDYVPEEDKMTGEEQL